MSGSTPEALLEASLSALGIPTPQAFEARVHAYLAELDRWNQVRHLTGYRRAADQLRHLILESLLLLQVLPDPATPLLDIGTGPGVPGLILKLARPDWEVTLLEAKRWRVNFLRHVVRALALEGVEVWHGRAEALAEDPERRMRFRSVTLRAVATPAAALRLARPFLQREGHVVVALGPHRAGGGRGTREVTLDRVPGMLPLRRAFLIIGAAEIPDADPDVSRGTPEARGAHSGGRQSKGRGGQDHHGGEPRGRSSGGGAGDPPG